MTGPTSKEGYRQTPQGESNGCRDGLIQVSASEASGVLTPSPGAHGLFCTTTCLLCGQALRFVNHAEPSSQEVKAIMRCLGCCVEFLVLVRLVQTMAFRPQFQRPRELVAS